MEKATDKNLKKTKVGRTQQRFQEFVKKFHPDVLRNRFRNFRKFLITSVTDQKNSNQEAATSSQQTQVLSSEESHRLQSSTNCFLKRSELKYSDKYPNVDKESYSTSDGNSDVIKVNRRTSWNAMDASVPDVIVQKDETVNTYDKKYFENGSNNNLQIVVNVEVPSSRNKSPVTVQEWVDSLPLTPNDTSPDECDMPIPILAPVIDSEADNLTAEPDNLTLGAEAVHLCSSRKTSISNPPVNVTITSYQEPSEVESHCSSVDSLLEARKPDPEEILLSLGFGGAASSNYLETGRIPKRFLSPSQLKGVDIEEFIRQQQDLIYTFESGYYGYRGLAGPSHSNPSVIVAKILEKLRDHEKESVLMNSYHPDFKKRSSVDQFVIEDQPKKFSKVARNVLTKIRCTPGSVLSPDNRRWLDSQGNKSPEIARRLIIGQKSFTFGNDGDLIESVADGNTERNNNEESVQKNNIDSNCSTEEQMQIELREQNDETENIHCKSYENTISGRLLCNSNPTEISTNLSTENTVTKECDSNYNNPDQLTDEPKEVISNINDLTSSTLLKSGISDKPPNIYSPVLNNVSKECSTSVSLEGSKLISSTSVPECKTNNVTKEPVSLLEELVDSAFHCTEVNGHRDSTRRTKNVLTRCSSFDESVKADSDDETSLKKKKTKELHLPERTENLSDSATESEFASYPHRTLLKKDIREQYEELVLLESKLRNSERPLINITEEKFSSLSSEQRCCLQSKIIRDALQVYHNQLLEDDINLELKNCLTIEARKVADLLDDAPDTNKLSVIVRQMILLLQQQRQLSAQIKELIFVDKKPSSCHEMCNHVLKRIQELELLVQQNAQELAHMKYQLLNRK